MQEFSYIIDTNHPENLPATWVLEPTGEENEEIQKRLGLKGLKRFKAQVSMEKDPHVSLIRLHIHLSAQVVQSCVVTLESIEEKMEEAVDLILKPGPLEESDFEHIPEILELPKNGKVDIGEIMIQNLGLMLPQFPKKSEIKTFLFELSSENLKEEKTKKNPFEALKKIDKKIPPEPK